MVILNKDNRTQYVYMLLTGVITIALINLIYISIRLILHEEMRENVKLLQRNIHLIKPTLAWNYNNSWNPIGKVSLNHQIYSAYFDYRTEIIDNLSVNSNDEIIIGTIRTFPILPRQLKDPIKCILRFDDFTTLEMAAIEAKSLNEDHGHVLAIWIIMCPIIFDRRKAYLNDTMHLPNALAIGYPTNPLSLLTPTFVQISYPRDMNDIYGKTQPTIAICVAPLQLNYSNVLRIVEFIEMYHLLGATHFYFYNMASTNHVERILNYYKEQHLAEVFAWHLSNSYDDLHYAGIVAQYNECILRAMVVDNYRYAAVIDLDEILMPLKHNTLKDYLRQCDEGHTSAFVFRNVFFYNKDVMDTFNQPKYVKNSMLYTQTKIRRTVEIMPAYTRSKCIVNTRSIIEMGNHRVWRSVAGYSEHILHQSVGLLHHYRDKCINCKSLMVVDYTARRFGSLIWQRVDDVCLNVFLELNGVCPLH